MQSSPDPCLWAGLRATGGAPESDLLPPSRRNGLAVVWATLGLTLILPGCEWKPATQSHQDGRGGAGPEPVFSQESGAAKSEPSGLSLLTWSDYLAPELVDEFEARHAMKIELTEIDNSEQLMQSLAENPESFDVVIADDQSIKRLIELRLISELDRARLPGFAHLAEDFTDLEFDPGNRYSVPYLWGLTVIAYRSDKIALKSGSWKELWREDLKGRLAILDEPDEMLYATLFSLGHHPGTASEAQVDEAVERLTGLFTESRGRMRDCLASLDELEAGTTDLVVTYGGDAAARAARNPAIAYAIPDEGTRVWVDSFAVSRDSGRRETAHRFIDFMLSPEAAALSANHLQHSSPNASARPLIDPVLLRNPVLYPGPEMRARCRAFGCAPETERFVRNGVGRLFQNVRRAGIDPEGGPDVAASPAEEARSGEEEAPGPGGSSVVKQDCPP